MAPRVLWSLLVGGMGFLALILCLAFARALAVEVPGWVQNFLWTALLVGLSGLCASAGRQLSNFGPAAESKRSDTALAVAHRPLTSHLPGTGPEPRALPAHRDDQGP